MTPWRCLLLCALTCACSGPAARDDSSENAPDAGLADTDGGDGAPDSGVGDGDGGLVAPDAGEDAPDAGPPPPSPDDCLENWRELDGRCPAPVITASYVAEGCVGTTGWFVDGANFELDQHNVGIADYGPQSMGANGNQRHWNVITPTRLCVTVFAGYKATWVGHEIYVVNPDGKRSNAVVVEDRL